MINLRIFGAHTPEQILAIFEVESMVGVGIGSNDLGIRS